jgi:hypothetical protein
MQSLLRDELEVTMRRPFIVALSCCSVLTLTLIWCSTQRPAGEVVSAMLAAAPPAPRDRLLPPLPLLPAMPKLPRATTGVTRFQDEPVTGAPGPWGRLSRQTLVLEPPESWFSFDSCQTDLPVWRVPASTHGEAEAWLREHGVAEDEAVNLAWTARCELPELCLAFPDELALLSLTPVARLLLCEDLNDGPLERADGRPHRRPRAWDLWGVFPSTSERTRALIRHLSFEHDQDVLMGDLQLLCRLEASRSERVAIQHDLWRRLALAVRLTVPEAVPIEDIVAYWDRGFRAKSVRALVRSAARYGDGQGIDLIHLLPPIPRMLLNTYPELGQPERDCHWTALSFFDEQPDDRYLDGEELRRVYREDYVKVQRREMRYGDVVLFVSASDRLLHASVYLADGLVFTKNGHTPLQPWVITDLASMWRMYGRPPEMKVIRLKRLVRHGGAAALSSPRGVRASQGTSFPYTQRVEAPRSRAWTQ